MSPSATATRNGVSRNESLKSRLLQGEHLTSQQVQEEYGGSRSGLQWALRTMKREGYAFKSRKVDGNAQEYWLDLKKSDRRVWQGNGSQPVEPEGQDSNGSSSNGSEPPSTMEKLRERLEAGEGLIASEIAQEYDTSPNVLSVTLAQMTKEGYAFTHDPERTVDANGKPKTLKRHRMTGKGDPMPSTKTVRKTKKSSAGFRIPAPQVDALTEITLVHRIDDSVIQVGMSQGGHQWLLEVRSYVE